MARIELRAALPHHDRAALDLSAAKHLDAKTLTRRVTPVLRGATDLFGGPSPLQGANNGLGGCRKERRNKDTTFERLAMRARIFRRRLDSLNSKYAPQGTTCCGVKALHSAAGRAPRESRENMFGLLVSEGAMVEIHSVAATGRLVPVQNESGLFIVATPLYFIAK